MHRLMQNYQGISMQVSLA